MSEDVKVKKIVAEADKKSRAHKRFLIFALVGVFALFCVFAYFYFFNITDVEIRIANEDVYTKEEIFESTGIELGENLFEVRSQEIEKELERSHPYIKEAKVIKQPFSTILIDVTLDKPAMALFLADKYYLLSSTGKVLGTLEEISESKNICILQCPNLTECIQGEKVQFESEENYEILMDVYSSFEKNEINEFLTLLDTRDKFNIKAVLDNRFEVIIGTYEEMDAKITLLKNVYKRDLWTDFSGIIDVFDPREAAVRFTDSSAN